MTCHRRPPRRIVASNVNKRRCPRTPGVYPTAQEVSAPQRRPRKSSAGANAQVTRRAHRHTHTSPTGWECSSQWRAGFSDPMLVPRRVERDAMRQSQSRRCARTTRTRRYPASRSQGFRTVRRFLLLTDSRRRLSFKTKLDGASSGQRAAGVRRPRRYRRVPASRTRLDPLNGFLAATAQIDYRRLPSASSWQRPLRSSTRSNNRPAADNARLPRSALDGFDGHRRCWQLSSGTTLPAPTPARACRGPRLAPSTPPYRRSA